MRVKWRWRPTAMMDRKRGIRRESAVVGATDDMSEINIYLFLYLDPIMAFYFQIMHPLESYSQPLIVILPLPSASSSTPPVTIMFVVYNSQH
ncbi:hypothetical protein BJ165DRAFT_1516967, partial [Panaeolus papilionaceus]